MLKFVSILLLAMFYESSQNQPDIPAILKKYPTWSFKVENVESLVEKQVATLRRTYPNLNSYELKKNLTKQFSPGTTHILRKIGDPKWSKNPPKFFDAREHWKECAHLIGQMDDEASCGVDGPVAAAAMASDRYCIYTNGTFKQKLSAEMLAGCAEMCTKWNMHSHSVQYIEKYGIPTGGSVGSNEGCLPYNHDPCIHAPEDYKVYESGTLRGSNKDEGIQKGPKEMKKCLEYSRYDYGCPVKCSNPKYQKSLDEDRVKLSFSYWLSSFEFATRAEILAYGPVTSSIWLYDDFFTKPDDWYFSHSNKYVAGSKQIKLIGWGEDPANKNRKYWLAINTWDQWGDKVFKIWRGVNYLNVDWNIYTGVFGEV